MVEANIGDISREEERGYHNRKGHEIDFGGRGNILFLEPSSSNQGMFLQLIHSVAYLCFVYISVWISYFTKNIYVKQLFKYN